MNPSGSLEQAGKERADAIERGQRDDDHDDDPGDDVLRLRIALSAPQQKESMQKLMPIGPMFLQDRG